MTDTQLFLLVLIALYLIECLTLSGKDVVAFSSPWCRRWRVAFPSGLFGSRRLGMLAGNPVPPLGTTLLCQPWPFSVSPAGIYAYAALTVHPEGRPDQDGRYLPWTEVRNVSVREKRVLVNGAEVFKADSPVQALGWAVLISALSKLPEDRRAGAIEHTLGRSLDAGEVLRRVEEYRDRSRWLRRAGVALFAHLFVLTPAVAFTVGLLAAWAHLLGGAVVLMGATALLLNRAYRSLYPDADTERLVAASLAATVPMISIRAVDYLSRPLLAGCHPVAAARALLAPDDLRAFLRRVLLDARQPIRPECPSGDEAVRATEMWFRGHLRRALERFASESGIDPDEVSRPPAAQGPTSRTYCPRCGNQFVLESGSCPDCGGMPLSPLPGSSGDASRC